MKIHCAICQDLFNVHSIVNILSCGHMYHNECLGQWLAHNTTCPQCRARNFYPPIRVYFNMEQDGETDANDLQQRLDSMSLKVHMKDQRIIQLESEKKINEEKLGSLKTLVEKTEATVGRNKETILCLKEQVRNLEADRKKLRSITTELDDSKTKLQTLENVEKIIRGTTEAVSLILKKTDLSRKSFEQLCTYVEVLKLELTRSENKRQLLLSCNKEYDKKINELNKVKDVLERKVNEMKFELEELKRENNILIEQKENRKRKQLSTTNVNNKLLKTDEYANPSSVLSRTNSRINEESTSCSKIVDDLLSSGVESSTKNSCEISIKITKSPVVYQCSKPVVNCLKSSPCYNFNTLNIFQKKAARLQMGVSSSSSKASNYSYNGMGGTSKIPYKPTPRQELIEVRTKLNKEKTTVKRPQLQKLTNANNSITQYLTTIYEEN